MAGVWQAEDDATETGTWTIQRSLDAPPSIVINEVLPADQVLARTLEYARNLIATVSPNSLRQTRWLA